MSLDSFAKDFMDYVELVTGRPTIKSPSKGPQLKDPYCSVKILSAEALDHDVETNVCDSENDLLVSNMRGLTLVTFEVSSWGGANYMSSLSRLKTSFWSAFFLDELISKGFGLGEISGPIDISAPLISSKFEDRSQLTCSFYTSILEIFDIDSFNNIDITINEDNLPYSKMVNVNLGD